MFVAVGVLTFVIGLVVPAPPAAELDELDEPPNAVEVEEPPSELALPPVPPVAVPPIAVTFVIDGLRAFAAA